MCFSLAPGASFNAPRRPVFSPENYEHPPSLYTNPRPPPCTVLCLSFASAALFTPNIDFRRPHGRLSEDTIAKLSSIARGRTAPRRK